MIRLIASDLDGTLLDGNKHLPEEIFGLISELEARGILFAAASGRQYANLRALFAPVAKKVLFLCENGALVKFREKTLFRAPVEDALLPRVLAEIRRHVGLFPMLCGENCAYIESREEPFYSISMAAYTNCKCVSSLEEVIGKEPVAKIAVYDALGAAEHCIRVLPPRLPALRCALSGAEWCDISAPDVDKGAAIRYLRNKFHLRREECVAFGDHMNDYEMLVECGRAYVPENGYPPLIRLIGQTVPSNDAGGVIQKIRALLKEETL